MHRALTRMQSRRYDQLAMERYGVPGIVLMENAGRGCVEVMSDQGVDGPVLVLAGTGNNGGDGWVMARHLVNRGHDVGVIFAGSEDRIRGDARVNFDIARRMAIPFRCWAESKDPAIWRASFEQWWTAAPSWIVDALLGTGASGDPREPYASLIQWANSLAAKKLAVDIPSGLDCDSGDVGDPTFRADVTCTMVAPKVGLQGPGAAQFVGQVHCIDIGAPAVLLDEVFASRAE